MLGRTRWLFVPAALLLIAGCTSSAASPGASPSGVAASPSASVTGPTASAAATPSPSPTPQPYGNLILYRVPTSSVLGNADFWLIGADGTDRRKLASGKEAHWNADGSAVEVVSWDKNCVPVLQVYPVDGGAPTTISIQFAAGDDWFDWTPDGTRLSFFRYSSGKMPYPCGQNGTAMTKAQLMENLYDVNSDGTGLQMIQSKVPSVEPAAWLPDGSALVMIRKAAFSPTGPIVRIDVTAHTQTTVVGSGDYNDITVSPDGKLVSFTKYDPAHSTWRLHVAAADGSANHDLGSATTYDYHLVWGADDSHAALLRSLINANNSLTDKFYWFDPTVSPATFTLLSGGAEPFAYAAWSPDDGTLAYVDHASTGIFVIKPDGTGKQALAGTAKVEWLAWQPKP
jgi:dipeptidyl aminopeptidase/acylaminoacyl peptidase